MPKVPVLVYPSPVLRHKSTPVDLDNLDFNLSEIILDLIDTMQAHGAAGISAPQIGVTKRIIVLPGSEPIILINPIIYENTIKTKEKVVEGCLSFPDIFLPVERFTNVLVSGIRYYETGNHAPYKEVLHGLAGQAAQHEIEHLDGILLIDHAGKLKKEMMNKKMKKFARRLHHVSV